MHNENFSCTHIHNFSQSYPLSHFDTPTVYKRIHLPIQPTGNRVKTPVQLQGRDAGTTNRVGSPVQLQG